MIFLSHLQMIYHKLLNLYCIYYHLYCMQFQMVGEGDPYVFLIILLFTSVITWIHVLSFYRLIFIYRAPIVIKRPADYSAD